MPRTSSEIVIAKVNFLYKIRKMNISMVKYSSNRIFGTFPLYLECRKLKISNSGECEVHLLKLESLKVDLFYKISKIEHFIGKNICPKELFML